MRSGSESVKRIGEPAKKEDKKNPEKYVSFCLMQHGTVTTVSNVQ